MKLSKVELETLHNLLDDARYHNPDVQELFNGDIVQILNIIISAIKVRRVEDARP